MREEKRNRDFLRIASRQMERAKATFNVVTMFKSSISRLLPKTDSEPSRGLKAPLLLPYYSIRGFFTGVPSLLA
jgi:hypothetical protein